MTLRWFNLHGVHSYRSLSNLKILIVTKGGTQKFEITLLLLIFGSFYFTRGCVEISDNSGDTVPLTRI